MIQRIQTIFLLLAAASALCTLLFPFATTENSVTNSALFNDREYSANDNIILILFFALAGLLALISIFQFRRRPLQLKLNIFALIADVLGIVMLIILLIQDDVAMDPDSINDGLGVYLPLAFLVFGLLAMRFIRKDEELVQSMDRLR
jgi:glucan phosphoethanolaminetransferase (alkaline phosphatase superfamily)